MWSTQPWHPYPGPKSPPKGSNFSLKPQIPLLSGGHWVLQGQLTCWPHGLHPIHKTQIPAPTLKSQHPGFNPYVNAQIPSIKSNLSVKVHLLWQIFSQFRLHLCASFFASALLLFITFPVEVLFQALTFPQLLSWWLTNMSNQRLFRMKLRQDISQGRFTSLLFHNKHHKYHSHC